MGVNYNSEIDNIGGGGFGGLGGGGGMLPLWLLLFLGITGKGNGGFFGGDGHGGGAGVLAGETQAKLDCLQQGHNSLAAQIAEQTTGNRFVTQLQQINELAGIQRANTAELAGIQRDSTAAITGVLNDMRADAAECCCENRIGQQEIKTAIAMQTNDLVVNSNNNTQRIIDQLAANTLAACQMDAANLRSQLNEQRILNAIAAACGAPAAAV